MNKIKRIHDKYYIYILYDPTFISKRFYVGYSYDPLHRLSSHVNKKEENPYKDNWINKLAKRKIKPVPFIIASYPTEEQVWEAEIQLIAFCRSITKNIINILDGGNKPPQHYGEEVSNAKLTNKQAQEIRNQYFIDGCSTGKLAKQYNVTKRAIQNIIQYKTYIENIEIPENLGQLLKERSEQGKQREYQDRTGANNGRAKVDEPDVIKMRKLFDTGDYTKITIAAMFGITPTTAGHIINRKTWTHI